MKTRKLSVLCVAAGLMFAQAASADVNVGISVSSTGPGAALGIPEKNTFALLPTEVGGEKINYIVLDDATDPSVATKNARKLVSEHQVDLLIGSSVTPSSLAIAEIAVESHTPQITLAPVNLPPEKNTWVFRAPQQNKIMATALVAHMKAAGVRTLGFIGYSDAYGEDWLTTIEPLLSKEGIKMTAVERFNRTDTSVGGQTLKLIAARPDAVLVVASGSPAALPQTTLKERGFKGQIYQTHAAANPAFLKVAGKAAEGTIMPIGPVVVVDQIPDAHPSKASGLAFVKAYEAKYGARSFSSFAGHAHDAFKLLEAAMPVALKSARPGTAEFRQALRDAIEASREVVGVHGVFTMTPEDHFGMDERGRVLIEVQAGGYKLLPM
ncbi:ABC transporter substrate-binding protein [Denitromonas iodatirespirans]|uniref:ABC transporter substrate-binding protein n=1 Tax=Denitromonas iodatirespirans TaxID=2795389 RepID=A0A944HF70_DENI1|nr:ABC transporter substrate-binding protein [Denitromonas iodatirespirans]MBT0963476.1 ABC transporter substrate-binding protein [Denitromonas iodatirespirans]